MAKAKGMPRNYGHAQGSKNVEKICEAAYKMGVKYLTVYAFSTENWSRPKSEVDALMKLLRNYMKTCLKTAEKNRMRVRVIGDKTGLDEDIRTRIEELEGILKNAEVVVEDEVDFDKINVGCTVKVFDITFDEEMEFKIVGSTEANSLEGKISNESPVGQALIGKSVGDVVEVETQAEVMEYKVLDISRSQ